MYYLKSLTAMLVLFTMFAGPYTAQAQGGKTQEQSQEQEYSDEELKKFLAISTEIQKVRQEKRSEMQKAIQEAGLTMQRYQTIKQRMMGRGQAKNKNRGKGESDEVTKKEKKQFEEAQSAVSPIQKTIRKESKSIIEANDMSESKFREIAQALRNDRNLQKRVRSMQSQNKSPRQN